MNTTEKIKAIRASQRLSKATIAKELDMDFSQYSRQENKGDKLTIEQASMIAQALRISLTELLTWGEDALPPNSSDDCGRPEPPAKGLAGLYALAWKGKQPHRFLIEVQLSAEHYLVKQVGSEWEKTVVGQIVTLDMMNEWQIGTQDQLDTILTFHTRNKVVLYPSIQFLKKGPITPKKR